MLTFCYQNQKPTILQHNSRVPSDWTEDVQAEPKSRDRGTEDVVVGSHVTEPADYVIHLPKSPTYELDHCQRQDNQIVKVDHLTFKFKNFCLR